MRVVERSRSPAKSPDKLSHVRGLPRPVENAHGLEIIEATQRGLATAPGKFPFVRAIEPGPTERFRADALWAAAQCICAANGVDAALLTSRQEIGELQHAIMRKKDISHLRLMQSWRKEALGDILLGLVERGEELHLAWTDGALHSSLK